MNALVVLKIVGLIVGAVASVLAARQDPKAVGKRRGAIIVIGLGFGVAVVTELVDTSQKQNAAREAMERNNAVLAEVQRTLHPLFPLSINVRWRAALTNDATRAFRTQLEQIYKRDARRIGDVVALYPSDPEFPTCKNDPVGFEIVSAVLSSEVRFYSRQRTKEARFQEADVRFSPSIQRDFPSEIGDAGKAALRMPGDFQRRIIEERGRDYLFSLDHGLFMSDGYQKIVFVDSKNTTDMVSVDDLLGATLEIVTEPLRPEDKCPSGIPAQSEWITFAGIAIILPGWRQLVIDHQMFTVSAPPKDSKDWSNSPRYRFKVPEQKSEFEKLIKDERIEVAAARP